MLPEPDAGSAAPLADDDATEAPGRLEINAVTPPDPYAGSSILIAFTGARLGAPLHVYAGKVELDVIAAQPSEVVARLPRELPAGPLKIRLAASADGKDGAAKRDRSKPYYVRIKAPNLRKIFRSLLGGAALVALGIGLLARGVRESTGLSAARAVTRATQRRSVSYGFGMLTGALAQSTTSAAGVLAALASSGVLPLVPAALAFVGAQGGATVAPLLVAGLIEPREGLIAVAIGAIWLALGTDRRGTALGRLILGVGFVAFGLQVFRPGLEPFVADPVLLSLADRLRADTPADIATCALLGTLLVAALQGPAPVIVLILGVAQTTGRWDLTSALSLLAGTGLGAALAALLTASVGSHARRLARLHLWLGVVSTLFAAATVPLWTAAAELLLGPEAAAFSGVVRAPLHELGAPLALAFGLSQLACAPLLSALAPRLSAWAGVAKRTRRELDDEVQASVAGSEHAGAAALARALALHETALASLSVLAQTGARSCGRRAEHALAEARAVVEAWVATESTPHHEPPRESEAAGRGSSAFACLQLQHSLEALLRRTERVTEARLVHADRDLAGDLSHSDEILLRELHILVSQGLGAMRQSLTSMEPPDLDRARAREIRINSVESRARRAMSERRTKQPVEQHVHVLQVVDAYEVVGNQVYRLAEALHHRLAGSFQFS